LTCIGFIDTLIQSVEIIYFIIKYYKEEQNGQN